jgi:hypothetical protein
MKPIHPTPWETWVDLTRVLDGEFSGGARPLPPRCVDLLGEAVAAFTVRAFEGVAMLCRAAVEAAAWDYLYLDWKGLGWGARDIVRDREGKVARWPGLEEIGQKLFDEGALPASLRDSLGAVKYAGDAAAHVAPATVRADEAAMAAFAKAFGESLTAGKPLVTDPIQPSWVDESEAQGLIRDSAAIVQALHQSSARRSRREHPEWFPERTG